MYDYGYAELAAAIVKQAVDDWRHICRTGTDLSSDTKRHPLQYASTYASFGKLQAFFQSDWCEMLCGDNARNKVFNALQAERAESMQQKRSAVRLLGRRARLYQHDGETHTLGEWAKIKGIGHTTLWGRMKKGLTFEQALSHKSGTNINI